MPGLSWFSTGLWSLLRCFEPRSPRTPRPRSRLTTGRPSSPRTSSQASMPSPSCTRTSTRSPSAGATPTPPRCASCCPTGSLTHYLRCPREHWTRVRHSNFIERTLGETRRRAKVIDRLPGETSCIRVVWAVLDRSSRGARGFTMTPPDCGCSRTCAAPCSNHPPRYDTPTHQPPTDPTPSGSWPNINPHRGSLRRLNYTARETPPRLGTKEP